MELCDGVLALLQVKCALGVGVSLCGNASSGFQRGGSGIHILDFISLVLWGLVPIFLKEQ